MKIEARTFFLPDSYIGKISPSTINEHIALYAGYVKNANLILQELSQSTTTVAETYKSAELYRRFAFEYNGIRNHEHYFEQLENGPVQPSSDSSLSISINQTFGSWSSWQESFIQLAKTRGIGWAVLWHDTKSNSLIQSWVDEQHIGQLNECKVIYAIDLWEHSYVHDYLPSEKPDYISDYLANTNWSIVEKRFIS